MEKKHHKHPPLKRAKLGRYHRLEWAIYGTTCGEIEAFYDKINAYFTGRYRLSYVDADHSDSAKNTLLQVGKKKYSQDHVVTTNSFDDKFNLAASQAIFVNGNHYPASRQIVFINPKKRDSLHRRVDQLDAIAMVILPDATTEIYDFVAQKMKDNTIVLRLDEEERIFNYLEEEIKNQNPSLKALILAGGKSSRMKEDKSQLKYHNQTTQEEYLAQMCKNIGLETYISKSSAEVRDVINGLPIIKDRYVEMGPFGAIMSAFLQDPDSAWLVLACDLPFMSEEVVSRLIAERSEQHLATAYRVEKNPFPEPLIAIYEPAIYRRMLSFLSLGYACPRKVLINSDVKEVILADGEVAFNANTPEEYTEVVNRLKSKD